MSFFVAPRALLTLQFDCLGVILATSDDSVRYEVMNERQKDDFQGQTDRASMTHD